MVFLLERIGNASEAGKYAGAYRLLDAANMIGYLLASFLLPYIARHHSDGKIVTNVILNVRHVLIVFSITVSAIVIFLAPWIQKTLYHHNDPSYVEVMQLCIPALLFYSLIQVYGAVLTATGRIAAFSYIIFVSVVINVVINILFIPSFGAKASCLAALISQAFCAMTAIWYARQKLDIPIHLRSGLIYILTGAMVCGFLYLSKDLAVSAWLIMIGAGVIALIMLWVTKLIDLRNWKVYLRQ